VTFPPNVGEKTASDIAMALGTFTAIRKAGIELLQAIEGVGTVVARSVADFFGNPAIDEGLDRLLLEVKPRAAAAARGAPSAIGGKTFVFTGTLEHLTRSEAEKLVAALGGKASASVSAKTDYVVYGPGAGTKLDKARDLGIPTLREEEFLKLVGREGD
jgi:DNA ligase (NAD+)